MFTSSSNPSNISGVTGVKAGVSTDKVAPTTSSLVSTLSSNEIKRESTSLGKCIGFSKSLAFIVSPVFRLYFKTAFSFPSVNSSSVVEPSLSSSSIFLAPSTISEVSGVNESTVFNNLAPITSPTFKQLSGIVNSPESTISGNISGSSRLSADNIVPSSVLQQTTACSFFNSSACSAVIDISNYLLFYYFSSSLSLLVSV